VKILGFLEGGEGDVERGRLVGVEEIDPVRETQVAGNLPERGIFSKSEKETIRAIRGWKWSDIDAKGGNYEDEESISVTVQDGQCATRTKLFKNVEDEQANHCKDFFWSHRRSSHANSDRATKLAPLTLSYLSHSLPPPPISLHFYLTQDSTYPRIGLIL
jgi:hypothetical protein